MVKNRIAAALLCGSGFASLSLLLINLSVLSPFLDVFILPGGILAGVIVRPEDLGPPLLILAGNALAYSAVALAGISVFGRDVTPERLRAANIRLVLPVAILIGMICIPKLNPLWPRGMAELARQEGALQETLRPGMGIEDTRSVLRSMGIQFNEQTRTSPVVILERQDRSITAVAGDRVIFVRLLTGAAQFPCGYDMQVVLLFGLDGRMRDQYVRRLRLCP